MRSAWLPLTMTALVLAGCATSGPGPEATAPAPAPILPASIQPSEIIGRWGYAAYHRPDDRARTERNARGQCNKPFAIDAGPNGGVLMYLADRNERQEVRLKGGPENKNYLGPADQPGGSQEDIQIVDFDGRVMVMRYMDPEVHSRIGFGIYVRCGARA